MTNPVKAEPGKKVIPGEQLDFNNVAPTQQQQIDAAVDKAVSKYSAKIWGKKKKPEDDYFEIDDLPSGQIILARKLSPMLLIEHDLLDEIDFFSRKLFPAKLDAAGNPIENEEGDSFLQILSKPEKRQRFFNLLDRMLELALVEPKVIAKPEGELPENAVAASEIDLDDKMHIFNVLNDPQDRILKFRSQQDASMANVESVKDVPQTTE